MEKWIKIKGFKEHQEVSNTGFLRSLNYKNSGKIKVLKPTLTKDGYLKTMLKNNEGKYKTIAVHRIVAENFLNKIEGYEVNHINGIKTDNSVNNLEYVTKSYNCLHSFRLGLQKPKRGSLNGMAKLTDKEVEEIREYADKTNRKRGYNKYLQEKYNVSKWTITRIVSNETWK